MSLFSMHAVSTSTSAKQVAESLAAPRAAATTGSTSTSTASASDNGVITSSDFLTLLVTEMQNQDPTQPTDPNAYIQQLVGVNSLQQLISINQDLSGTTSSTSGTTSTDATGSVAPASGS